MKNRIKTQTLIRNNTQKKQTLQAEIFVWNYKDKQNSVIVSSQIYTTHASLIIPQTCLAMMPVCCYDHI